MLRYLALGLTAAMLVFAASCSATANTTGTELPTRIVASDPGGTSSGVGDVMSDPGGTSSGVGDVMREDDPVKP